MYYTNINEEYNEFLKYCMRNSYLNAFIIDQLILNQMIKIVPL